MNVIKWIGSKRKTAFNIVEVFNKLEVQPKRYIEPMCGGMSVAITYQHPNTVVNDVNFDLINLYHVLSNAQTRKEMFDLVCKLENNKEFYYDLRNVFNGMERKIDTDTKVNVNAAAFYYYLVNFGFRGLSRYNKEGFLNTAYGCVKASVKEYYLMHQGNLNFVGDLISDWTITCLDYQELDYQQGDLVYFDPPYGTAIPYITPFKESHLKIFLDFVKELDAKGICVAISYNDPKFIGELGQNFNCISFDKFQDFSNRHETECLFTNF